MAVCSLADCSNEKIFCEVVDPKTAKVESRWCKEHVAIANKRANMRNCTVQMVGLSEPSIEEEREPEPVRISEEPTPPPPLKMVVKPEDPAAMTLEKVVAYGDLSKLTAQERLYYYQAVCESLGLNPLTQPFAYITIKNKLLLYPRKECTDQLRTLRNISLTIVGREKMDDYYVVTARATSPDGRTDESIGAVTLKGLQGEDYANALMKAETKAKRRATLALCGLAMSDESEIASIPDARTVEGEMPGGEWQRKDLIRKLHALGKNVPPPVGPLNHDQLHEMVTGWWFQDKGIGELDTNQLTLFCDFLAKCDTRGPEYDEVASFFDTGETREALDVPMPRLAKRRTSDEMGI